MTRAPEVPLWLLSQTRPTLSLAALSITLAILFLALLIVAAIDQSSLRAQRSRPTESGSTPKERTRGTLLGRSRSQRDRPDPIPDLDLVERASSLSPRIARSPRGMDGDAKPRSWGWLPRKAQHSGEGMMKNEAAVAEPKARQSHRLMECLFRQERGLPQGKQARHSFSPPSAEERQQQARAAGASLARAPRPGSQAPHRPRDAAAALEHARQPSRGGGTPPGAGVDSGSLAGRSLDEKVTDRILLFLLQLGPPRQLCAIPEVDNESGESTLRPGSRVEEGRHADEGHRAGGDQACGSLTALDLDKERVITMHQASEPITREVLWAALAQMHQEMDSRRERTAEAPARSVGVAKEALNAGGTTRGAAQPDIPERKHHRPRTSIFWEPSSFPLCSQVELESC